MEGKIFVFFVLFISVHGSVHSDSNTTLICRPNDEFTCSDGKCIPFTWVCNGRVDCEDGGDEMDPHDCPLCPVGMPWQCRNGKCIMNHYVCEGWNDCGDWSDEVDPETGKCPPCPPKFIQCPETGKCFRSFQYCDGNNQCGNWWDEREEICPCPANTVRCPSSPGIYPAPPRACIPPEYFCDAEGIWDCPDGSDEANCTTAAV